MRTGSLATAIGRLREERSVSAYPPEQNSELDPAWWTPKSLEAKHPGRDPTCRRVLGRARPRLRAEPRICWSKCRNAFDNRSVTFRAWGKVSRAPTRA